MVQPLQGRSASFTRFPWFHPAPAGLLIVRPFGATPTVMPFEDFGATLPRWGATPCGGLGRGKPRPYFSASASLSSSGVLTGGWHEDPMQTSAKGVPASGKLGNVAASPGGGSPSVIIPGVKASTRLPARGAWYAVLKSSAVRPSSLSPTTTTSTAGCRWLSRAST